MGVSQRRGNRGKLWVILFTCCELSLSDQVVTTILIKAAFMGQEYPRVGQDAPNRFLIVAYLSPKRRTWLIVLRPKAVFGK